MKQNDNIVEAIRRNPLSQSISSLNKRGISIDSFKHNKRTIDSLRSSCEYGSKKTTTLENEAHNHSINTKHNNPKANEQSPLCSSKKSPVKMILPPQSTKDSGRKTLVLDLDETLVHSEFSKYKDKADIVINVTIDNKNSDVYVLIRPGTEVFLTKMSKLYELVIFTASISKYAEPLMYKLDQKRLVGHTLSREHCSIINNTAVKDLKRLNRDLKNVILVDNSPSCYSLNPENGFPIKTWIDDQNDRELFKLLPIFEFLSEVSDVRDYITNMQEKNLFSYAKAANIMNSYYSNQKKSAELSKSNQYKSRHNDDNTSYFNSFNQGKGLYANANGNGNNAKLSESNQKNAKLINSAYPVSIDPFLKENINDNDSNNYNMFKKTMTVEDPFNNNLYRKVNNARHQYNLSDPKVVFQTKTNTNIAESERNNKKPEHSYHTKHVSIIIDKEYSLVGTKESEGSKDNSNARKNSSACLHKHKQYINTSRDLNSNLHPHINNQPTTNEAINLTDIAKDQCNTFLMNRPSKYNSPMSKSIISTNPYSMRQCSKYLNKLNDNDKKGSLI